MRIKDTFIAEVLRSMRPGILFYVTHAATLRGRKVNECGRGTQILQNSRRHHKIVGAKQFPFWGPKNIRLQRIQFNGPGNLAPGIYGPLE